MDRSADGVVDVRSVVDGVCSNENGSPLYQVESLCMRCGDNGTTSFLFTVIPNFRKILLSSFECPHCGERNNESQFAGELQPRGCCYSLKIQRGDMKMLNRQVVKAEAATIKIPELDFEIPPEAQRGTLSTVEGILLRATNELAVLQEERKRTLPEQAKAIDIFLEKLKACSIADASFTFVLDDPSGNSFIENPLAPSPDILLSIKYYDRSSEQQSAMGYLADIPIPSVIPNEASVEQIVTNQTEKSASVGAVIGHRAIAQINNTEMADAMLRYSAPEEVMTFPSTCGACGNRCGTKMFVTRIPYFQEVIVMASSCDACGYRNSELKPGGPIPDKGKKITVHIKNISDLSRDVIKSDTSSIKVPELDLELTSGTLGGIVTTIEGLIVKISESLEGVEGFLFGDSLEDNRKEKWQHFKSKMNKLLRVEETWTLIIDDALANSFVAPLTDDMGDDGHLTWEEYERTWDQNEELGLNDIDTTSSDAAYTS